MTAFSIAVIGPTQGSKTKLINNFVGEPCTESTKEEEILPVEAYNVTIDNKYIQRKKEELKPEFFKQYFKINDTDNKNKANEQGTRDNLRHFKLNDRVIFYKINNKEYNSSENNVKQQRTVITMPTKFGMENYNSISEYLNDEKSYKPHLLVLVLNLKPEWEAEQKFSDNVYNEYQNFSIADVYSYHINQRRQDRSPLHEGRHYQRNACDLMHQEHLNYLLNFFQAWENVHNIPVVLVGNNSELLDDNIIIFKSDNNSQQLEPETEKQKIIADFNTLPTKLKSKNNNINIKAVYCPEIPKDPATVVKIFSHAIKVEDHCVESVSVDATTNNIKSLSRLSPNLTPIFLYLFFGCLAMVVPCLFKMIPSTPDIIMNHFNHIVLGGFSFGIAAYVVAMWLINQYCKFHDNELKESQSSKTNSGSKDVTSGLQPVPVDANSCLVEYNDTNSPSNEAFSATVNNISSETTYNINGVPSGSLAVRSGGQP